jgi:hypothetical protein
MLKSKISSGKKNSTTALSETPPNSIGFVLIFFIIPLPGNPIKTIRINFGFNFMHMNTPNYDAFASTFSKSRSHMRWPEIDILVTDMFRRFDASGIKTPPRILDVGCGNGRLLETLIAT